MPICIDKLAFVIMAPWKWHRGAGTCSSWYLSQMVYHREHIMGDVLNTVKVLLQKLMVTQRLNKGPMFPCSVQKSPPLHSTLCH